jgi:flagellar FliL protein
MAEATTTATAAEGDAKPAAGKSRKMLIIGVVVLVVALGGGGYYFMSHKNVAEGAKAAEKAPPKQLQYLPLDTFTVNLNDEGQERYLQISINLELIDLATAEAIKRQMPSVRNKILLQLSSKSAENLLSREGKEKLASELAEEMRKSLEGASPNKGLEQVLFSQFVIQ